MPDRADIAPRRSRRLRRAGIAIGVIAAAIGVLVYCAPAIAAWKLRRELAAAGYPDARFEVAHIGFDQLALRDVVLAPGLELGEVELDGGLSLLWRDPDTITIRHARITRQAAAALATSRGSLARAVRIEDGVVVVDGAQIAIDGTLALDSSAPTGHLVAKVAHWRAGPLTVDDVVVQIDDGHACATARLDGRALDACTELATWTPSALALAVTLRDPAWTAIGQLRVAELASTPTIDGHVDVAIPSFARDGVTLTRTAIAADVTGSAGALDVRADLRAARLEAADLIATDVCWPARLHATHASTGWQLSSELLELAAATVTVKLGRDRLRAETVTVTSSESIVVGNAIARPRSLHWTARRVDVGGARLDRATGSLDARGAIAWHAASLRWRELVAEQLAGTIATDHRIAWRATRASWRDVRASELGGSIDPAARSVAWHARELRRDDVIVREPSGTSRGERHVLAWHGVDAAAWSLGAGTVTLDAGAIESGSVHAYGATLAVAAPAQWGGVVALRVRDLPLAELVHRLGGDRVAGRGVLDGELAIRIAGTGWEVERATLATRGPGTLRVRDIAWVDRVVADHAKSPFALHERIAGALADFELERLSLVLAPRGTEPDLRIAVQGRGRRVPQVLDLVFNICGVRDTARHFRLARA
ncbi:MAG TPA: YdbH domain-containing protein [Kofleriaceae bacterium]|nr:YdbH domain-containing protein [Kofleriaceae bacterium]